MSKAERDKLTPQWRGVTLSVAVSNLKHAQREGRDEKYAMMQVIEAMEVAIYHVSELAQRLSKDLDKLETGRR